MAIAAITSCTNTSNPQVMVAAGLLARNAARRGLGRRPWVKTTLSPGSLVVMDYLRAAGLVEPLEALGFHLAGFGCMTCIGASGPLIEDVAAAVHDRDLTVVSVLSGNRNFEGRIHPEVKLNYLASPPLVVAYALAGTMDLDLSSDPLGHDPQGRPVFLADLWPSAQEVEQTVERRIDADMFRRAYAGIFDGDHRWQALDAPTGTTFAWDPASTYVRRPPHLNGIPSQPLPIPDIVGARVLVKLGDSITTDHISPAGAIPRNSDAGRYLAGQGGRKASSTPSPPAAVTTRSWCAAPSPTSASTTSSPPGTVGGVTRCFAADGTVVSIYEAARTYQEQDTPVVVIAGKDYGAGSSRDWAAKGPKLLGVRAILAESFERIHRSNLIGMGILPLQFLPGQSAQSLGLTGEETITIRELASAVADPTRRQVEVHADETTFPARVRLNTRREADYYHPRWRAAYVLRSLLSSSN